MSPQPAAVYAATTEGGTWTCGSGATLAISFTRVGDDGYYQVAAKAKVALAAAGGIIWNAALPAATQLWSEGDRAGFERLAQRSLRFICLLQLVVTAVFMACAG